MSSDSELFERWVSGDAEAGRQLFRRHYDGVARFFRNKVGAEWGELCQRTFLACLEAAPSFRREGSFRSFLFGIAYRQLRRHYQAQARERIDFGSRSIHDLDPTASAVHAAREEQQLLLVALRRIPLELQVILELVYWEELSAQACAEILDIPVGTAKSRLRRARERLEQALAELASSPEQLEQTRTRLADWARELRANLAAP